MATTTTKKKTAPKKKMGRPPIANPKYQVQTFRMTDKEKACFNELYQIGNTSEGVLCRKIMAMGLFLSYLVFVTTKKQHDPFAIATKKLLMAWTTDPQAPIPQTLFDEVMNSDEYPKDLKKDLLDFLG